MQLAYVNLEQNQLMGTLPESWSNLNSVSHRHQSVHLLIFVADLQSCKTWYHYWQLIYICISTSSSFLCREPGSTMTLLPCETKKCTCHDGQLRSIASYRCYKWSVFNLCHTRHTPLLMQLSKLYLRGNSLMGTLPHSWGNFSKVSQFQ